MEYTKEEREAIDDLNEGYLYAMRKDNIDMLVMPKEIEIVLNLVKKQSKTIKVLNKIICEDLPTNQKQIKTFCGIPIEEAMEIIESNKNKIIHLSDEEYRRVIDEAQKDCIMKKIEELKHTDQLIGYFLEEWAKEEGWIDEYKC